MRKSDASTRLKEVLKTRIQPSNDEVFEEGDTIITLNKDDEWEGPAKVITRESDTLHILFNGNMRKVAVC